LGRTTFRQPKEKQGFWKRKGGEVKLKNSPQGGLLKKPDTRRKKDPEETPVEKRSTKKRPNPFPPPTRMCSYRKKGQMQKRVKDGTTHKGRENSGNLTG